MSIRTYRDRLRDAVVPWLQQRNNARLLFAIAVQLDAMADALVAGVRLRFPNMYSGESLPYIGRERRIQRGPFESDEVYASRLVRWLDDHCRRGGPYAMLAQLHAFFAPDNFPIDLVYRNGRRYQMDVDGNVTRDDVVFEPDSHPEQWARWYLFYWTDAFPLPLSDDTLATLKLVPQEWNAAHALGTLLVMPTDAELIDYPPGHTIDESGTIDRPGPSAVIAIE